MRLHMPSVHLYWLIGKHRFRESQEGGMNYAECEAIVRDKSTSASPTSRRIKQRGGRAGCCQGGRRRCLGGQVGGVRQDCMEER